jgi:adenylate kinase
MSTKKNNAAGVKNAVPTITSLTRVKRKLERSIMTLIEENKRLIEERDRLQKALKVDEDILNDPNAAHVSDIKAMADWLVDEHNANRTESSWFTAGQLLEMHKAWRDLLLTMENSDEAVMNREMAQKAGVSK